MKSGEPTKDEEISCITCAKQAQVLCQICFVFYCKECFSYAHSNETDSHVSIEIAPDTKKSLSICDQHKMVCGMLCKTCEVAVCNRCVCDVAHKGHDLSVIEDLPDMARLADLLKLSSKQKDDIGCSIINLNYEIHRFQGCVKAASEALNQEYWHLINRLQLELARKQRFLQDRAQTRLQNMEKMRGTLHRVQHDLENALGDAENYPVQSGSEQRPNHASADDISSLISRLEVFEKIPCCVLIPEDRADQFQVEVMDKVSHEHVAVIMADESPVFMAFPSELPPGFNKSSKPVPVRSSDILSRRERKNEQRVTFCKVPDESSSESRQ